MTEAQLKEFLYDTLKRAGGVLDPGNPIICSSKNIEKKFMFFEFRSVEETSAAIQLDGIRFQDVNLRIRRPPEYDKNPEIKPRRPVPVIDTVALGIISTQVNDGSGKLFIGGLPREYTEDQVKNMLQRYGRLRSFHLVKETGELISRGFGFCEYVEDSCAENALSILNGMEIGSRVINLRRTQDHHPASIKT
jgi:splicing factor U2AF 65 kDa subunit